MPIFNLACHVCGGKRRVVRPQGWKSTQEDIVCRVCPGPVRGLMFRDTQGAGIGTLVKETIDNGARVKALERFADAERLHADRVEVEDALAKGKDTGRIIR